MKIASLKPVSIDSISSPHRNIHKAAKSHYHCSSDPKASYPYYSFCLLFISVSNWAEKCEHDDHNQISNIKMDYKHSDIPGGLKL
jgi:hypothetical protein